MDTKKEYAKRRRLISIMLFVIACLMLSLFFLRVMIWNVAVVLVSAVLVAACLKLNRCPKCKAKISDDDATKCSNCGCELK